MRSEIGRGFKFGVGFALGVSFVLMFFMFGISMCAGHLHRRMMEQMQEMMPGEKSPTPETQDDSVASQTERTFPTADKPPGLPPAKNSRT
jgi:hypothetical protein